VGLPVNFQQCCDVVLQTCQTRAELKQLQISKIGATFADPHCAHIFVLDDCDLLLARHHRSLGPLVSLSDRNKRLVHFGLYLEFVST
jgi:hypothetical protein